MASTRRGDLHALDLSGLDRLIALLAERGYRTRGPVALEGAIVRGPVTSVADLPAGYHDEHAPGSYRLVNDGGDELFGWAVGPQSWKPEFFPAEQTLWRGRASQDGFAIEESAEGGAPLAIIGARPCELAAIGVLDRVLSGGAHVDAGYAARRAGSVLVVAECGTPGGTCFCTSMGSGPAAAGGFDLALTELAPSPRAGSDKQAATPRYLLRSGSELGDGLLAELDCRPASAEEEQEREALLRHAEATMGRALETEGLPALLARNLEHPRWSEVAARCLSCGNCTMVCPTCFCSDVEDVSDLAGNLERRQKWASCFDLEHSYLHGGAVRQTVAARYRQWATHKLSTWHDQFATSGCVGCGRCITWCPVGIDLTEEVAAIRASDGLIAPRAHEQEGAS